MLFRETQTTSCLMKHRTMILSALLLVAACATKGPEPFGDRWEHVEGRFGSWAWANAVYTKDTDGQALAFACYLNDGHVVIVHLPGIETKAGDPRDVIWRADKGVYFEQTWVDDPDHDGSFAVAGDDAEVLVAALGTAQTFELKTKLPSGIYGWVLISRPDFASAIARMRQECAS